MRRTARLYYPLNHLAEIAATGVEVHPIDPDTSLTTDALAYALYYAYVSLEEAIITKPGPIARRSMARNREQLEVYENQVFPHERPEALEYAVKLIRSNDGCCVM